MARLVSDHQSRLEAHVRLLGAFDPSRQLARGWTLTRTLDGKAVTSIGSLAPGIEIITTFADGVARSSIASVEQREIT